MGFQFKDKRLNVIVNKIKLSEEIANWCIKLNKKYAIWIANQIKVYNLDYTDYEVERSFINILDWKKEVQNLNLNELNYEQASQRYQTYIDDLFSNSKNSLINKNIVIDCGEYKWVELTKQEDFVEEGNAMSHCVGGHGYYTKYVNDTCRFYSLRDKFNKPHITVECGYLGNSKEHDKIKQIQSKSNSRFKDAHSDYLLTLFKEFKFKGINQLSYISHNIDLCIDVSDNIPNFFTYEQMLKLGINPVLNGLYNEIKFNNVTLKKLIIKKDSICYGDFILNSSKTKVSFEDKFQIGGSLELTNISEIEILDEILVGGNVYIRDTYVHSEMLSKIKCFGEFIYEPKKDNVLV